MATPTSTSTNAALLFVAERDADVVLISSDEISFPVRKASLLANCEIFDDMFSAPSDVLSMENGQEGLPNIKLDDKGADLDLFLRFIVREQKRRQNDGQPISVDETKTLVHLADKYGAKLLIDTIDLSSLRAAVAADPPGLFGFAMSHGLFEMARDALALFQKDYVCTRNSYNPAGKWDPHTQPVPYRGAISGGAPYLMSDVPMEDLARVPFKTMLDLQNAQERVLVYGHKWADEAKKIKLA